MGLLEDGDGSNEAEEDPATTSCGVTPGSIATLTAHPTQEEQPTPGQEDAEEEGQAGGEQHLEWRVHVVFSPTWRVPVLYFTVCQLNGAPLTWEQVRAELPAELQREAEEGSPWAFVTQEFHPVTAEPCFMLHPCFTAQRMATLLPDLQGDGSVARRTLERHTYLISWLSLVGPCHAPSAILSPLSPPRVPYPRAHSLHSMDRLPSAGSGAWTRWGLRLV